MAPTPNELLTDLLKNVSRSFYLTLRVLPKSVRPQISLAYLLARTTDTVADTEIVPLEHRLRALQSLRERLVGIRTSPLDFGEMARHQGSPAERVLLENVEASLALLQGCSEADRKLICAVLDTITSGQELDLRRFGRCIGTAGEPVSTLAARGDTRPASQKIIALQTNAELDDYTYRVAGCAGEFWTRMCRTHVFPNAKLDDSFLLKNGVRFGKGLQLVNILRDLPADLGKGRCYLPAERLAALGLTPDDLLQPTNEPKLRPLYNEWLDHAEAHLAAGWEYTNRIPSGQMRIRLACAWPILIGRKTIRLLRFGNVLDPKQRIRISRGEVRWVVLKSVILHPLPTLWRRMQT